MSKPTGLPDFDEIADMYWRLGVMQSPTQLQGYLVGRLAVGDKILPEQWLIAAAGFIDAVEPPNEPESKLLQLLYNATSAQLDDGQMGLQLLLPDDAVDISQRVDSLSQWCQGFMVGFAEAGKQIQQHKGQQEYPPEVSEALNDMAAISQISLGEGDDDADQREKNFFEIEEYLRLAALTIYQECHQPAVVPATPLTAKNSGDEVVGSPGALFGKSKKKLH